MGLNEEQRQRYSRQIALPDVGEEGQERLLHGSVLVIGAGGLGSPVILYLAAAGVGKIGIADGDKVDLSNLQRQIIHDTPRIGINKAVSAARTVSLLNPDVKTKVMERFIDASNIDNAVADYDFIIDATDSPDIKMLINDTCVRAGKPLSFGAIYKYGGQTMTIIPGTPNLRDLFGEMPPREGKPVGPFGAVAGVIGSLQAADAVKYLAKTGELLTGRLLTFDALSMQFQEYEIKP